MRRTIAVLGFALAMSVSALVPGATRAAAREATFLIPASDGYGVAECLVSQSECGQVIAHAWCEAQGFALARTYGVAAPEDTTGSIEVSRTPEPSPSPAAVEARPVRDQVFTQSAQRGGASAPQGMSGTLDVEFFGEPSTTLSE